MTRPVMAYAKPKNLIHKFVTIITLINHLQIHLFILKFVFECFWIFRFFVKYRSFKYCSWGAGLNVSEHEFT